MFLIAFYLGYGRRKDMHTDKASTYHVRLHILSTGRYLHAFRKKYVS